MLVWRLQLEDAVVKDRWERPTVQPVPHQAGTLGFDCELAGASRGS